MNMTRKTFCASLAGSTVTLLLQSCGGGGYSSGGSSSTGSSCGASGSDIGGNHGHVLTIPRAHVELPTTAHTYALSPASVDAHVHSVTFTGPQLDTLRTGGSVTVTSTPPVPFPSYFGDHSHTMMATVIATCA